MDWLRGAKPHIDTSENELLLPRPADVTTRGAAVRSWSRRALTLSRTWVAPALELSAIVLWALWVGRPLINFDPHVWIVGGDFPHHSNLFFVWRTFWTCGTCVMWNGSVNGGSPAFGDFWISLLHPLVLVPGLLMHAINATKVAALASLIVGGVAQWWLGRVLGLGLVARLWTALLAVAAGHMLGRLQYGWVVLIISVACACLVLAPTLDLALTGRVRSLVVLSVTLALLMMSGHWYLQWGYFFAVLPAMSVFMFDARLRPQPVVRGFILAGLLALLLSAIYLLPLFHFLPNFVKQGPNQFVGVQPIEYIPLNLVINDPKFYASESLSRAPVPALYNAFIGWTAVILAVVGLIALWKVERRLFLFFTLALGLLYINSAGLPFTWLGYMFPGVPVLRHPSLVALLTVPLILGLAGRGLDLALRLAWPPLKLGIGEALSFAFSLRWLVLLPLLVTSVWSAYSFNSNYIQLTATPPIYYSNAQKLQTETSQWVLTPDGDMKWWPVGVDAGLKIVIPWGHRQWAWRGSQLPPTYIVAGKDPNNSPTATNKGVFEGMHVSTEPGNQYAFVDTGNGKTPCQAVAVGGNIDVTCSSDVPGTLVVREYMWSGWSARLDGAGVGLLRDMWLSVPVPAGEHRIEFRYRPWDVTLGFILFLVGVGLAIWLFIRGPRFVPGFEPTNEPTPL